jgi:hypothetical protein
MAASGTARDHGIRQPRRSPGGREAMGDLRTGGRVGADIARTHLYPSADLRQWRQETVLTGMNRAPGTLASP